MKLKEVFRLIAETFPIEGIKYSGIEYRKEFDNYPTNEEILEWVKAINKQADSPENKIDETSRIFVSKFFKLI